MSKYFESEIKLPSENELSLLVYSFGHNTGFMTAMCVIDGTKIKISCPSCHQIQTKTYSGKKKQNSLNLMIVTKLNGEIIYYSPLHIGVHNQEHFNHLNLHSLFIGKPYGLLADGEFTLNCQTDAVPINGMTHICATLANQRIKKKPLFTPDWKTKEWQAVFKQE